MIPALLLSPSFTRLRCRYVLTVLTLSISSSAISRTLFPSAMRQVTSCSRSDKLSWACRSEGLPSSRISLSATRSVTYLRPLRVRDTLGTVDPLVDLFHAAAHDGGIVADQNANHG